MTPKQRPVGICDQCGGPIPAADHYTSKGKPRLHCSVDCRNAANSRAGSPERSRKAKARVASGQWANPRANLSPAEISRLQALASRKARLRERAEGRWRNPALAAEARAKLSRPRRHTGALAEAIERLAGGARMVDLTPEQHAAYTAYRRGLRTDRLAEARAYSRRYYAERQAKLTPKQRAAQRAKWRAQNKKRRPIDKHR